jgi:hypothetical protein
MFPTRAQQIGVKPKVLAARTLKALAHHRQRLTTLALPYADIDNSVEGALDDLLAAFDEFAGRINETIEWLNEPANY